MRRIFRAAVVAMAVAGLVGLMGCASPKPLEFPPMEYSETAPGK